MNSPSARRQRVVRVLDVLAQARGFTTVTLIAHHLGVSPRSVHRDLAELRAAGVPIVGTIGVGIRLDLEAVLSLRATAGEAVAVLGPGRLLAWLGAAGHG